MPPPGGLGGGPAPKGAVVSGPPPRPPSIPAYRGNPTLPKPAYVAAPPPRPPSIPAYRGNPTLPKPTPKPSPAAAGKMAQLNFAAHSGAQTPAWSVPHVSGIIQALKAGDFHVPPVHISTGGGSLPYGSIGNELGAVRGGSSAVTGFLGRLASDAVNLPSSTLKGLEGLGSAAYDDFVTHGPAGALLGGHVSSPVAGLNYGQNDPHSSETLHLLSQAWHQSVLGHLARGDVSGALNTFNAHPLYGAQEFTGLYGLLGRGAGAVARSGALGEAAVRAAGTARADLPVVPGLAGDVQHYSKNVLTKQVQKAIEKHPQAQALLNDVKAPITTGIRPSFDSTTKRLRQRYNEFKMQTGARTAHAHATLDQALGAARPASDAAANVVPHVAMSVGGAQQHLLSQIENTVLPGLKHEAASGDMSPLALKNNLAHQTNLEAFLQHPDVQAARASAADYGARQAQLEAGLHQRGLLDTAQAERRAVLPYAHAQMPGVFHEPNGIPTEGRLAAVQAAKDVKVAEKAHQAAKLDAVKLTSKLPPEAKAVTQAEKAVLKLEGQTKAATSGAIGRYGQDAVGAGHIPPEAAARLDAIHEATAGARDHLTGLKADLAAARAGHKQHAQETVAAAKDTLLDAKQHKAAANELPQELKGHLILDPNTKMGYRELGTQEILDHMRANGVDPASYVRMNTPAERPPMFASLRRGRGGTKGKAFTGASVHSGSWTPGYGALGASQHATLNKLEQAITTDQYVHEFGQAKPSGQYFTDAEAPHAAQAFEAATGHPMVAVPAHPKALDQAGHDTVAALQNPARATHMEGHPAFADRTGPGGPGHNVLVPQEVHDQFLKHQALSDHPNRAMGWINQRFRNTVLPFSPKWVTGNAVEGGLIRGPMVGALPGRTGLVNKVLPAMGDAERARLEHSTLGGLHYGMQEKLNQEMANASKSKPKGPIGSAAAAVVKPYHDVVQKTLAFNKTVENIAHHPYGSTVHAIFGANHKMESSFEKTVLDTHMRNQLQEFANSMGKSSIAQRDAIKMLAEHYSNPAVIADAHRYIQQTLGQYNAFGPTMKKIVRSIAPFSPWYINSLKFVYHTLPLKHPVLQSALLDANRSIDKGWQQAHSNVPHTKDFGIPSGSLLSDVKTGPGDYLDLGRYTPMGAFTSGPVNYGLSMIGPQFAGAYNNLGGQDPFGRPLKGPHGAVTDHGDWALQALDSVIREGAGATNVLSRIFREHGDTPYNTSKLWDIQLKPGTHVGAPGWLGGLQRVLSPIEPTHLLHHNGAGKSSVVGTSAPVGGTGGSVGGKSAPVLGR